VIAFALSHATDVRADDPASLYDVFHYRSGEPKKDYLRAALEDAFLLGLGFVDDWRITAGWTDFGATYQWPYFHDKFSADGLSFDVNRFDTNFAGHPLKGTLYYTAARSNRLSILEAGAYALVISTFWEYIGEANQEASINDLVMTPVGGLAIGEALFQLAAYFDRQRPTFANRFFGALFGPVKTIHDAVDHEQLARCETEGCGPWHRFELHADVGATHQEGTPGLAGDTTFALGSRIVNLPGYDAPGKHAHAFVDGNVSAIGLRATFAQQGLVDGRVFFQTVPFGWYASRIDVARSGKLTGASGYVGTAVSFEYGVHDYDRDGARPQDQVSFVSVGPSAEIIGHAGGVRLEGRLDAAFDFGGVNAYALGEYLVRTPGAALPTVLAQHGYYFAGGLTVAPSLAISVGPLELGGRAQLDAFLGFLGADEGQSSLPYTVSRSDQRTELSGWLAWRARRDGLRLFVAGRGGERSGRMGTVAVSRSEVGLATGMEVRF